MSLLQYRSIIDAMQILNKLQSMLLWESTPQSSLWPIEMLKHASTHIGQELKNDTTY